MSAFVLTNDERHVPRNSVLLASYRSCPGGWGVLTDYRADPLSGQRVSTLFGRTLLRGFYMSIVLFCAAFPRACAHEFDATRADEVRP